MAGRFDGPQVIKIDGLGNIKRNEKGELVMYLLDDKNKDISHVIVLSKECGDQFEQFVTSQVRISDTYDCPLF